MKGNVSAKRKFIGPVINALIAVPLLTGLPGTGHAADSFYEKKILTLISAGPAGSVYDLYTRTLAEFLPKFIPGHPTAVVQDMPGAGGNISAGYMFNKAPRDGTVIASAIAAITTDLMLHPEVDNTFDVTKLGWIGSITKDAFVAYVRNTSPVQSYEEAKKTQTIMGGVAIGGPSVDWAVISNALFGTKFKIVPGYSGDPSIELAVERGEIDGSFGSGYTGIKTRHAEWLRDHKIKIILQHGLEKVADLPDVPLFIDQAKTAEDRTALQLVLTQEEFNKPIYAPPGIPRDRLDILRRAFESVVKDQEFLAAAAKANLAVTGPMSGEDLTTGVIRVVNSSPSVVERVRNILANFKQ
jgi:tripartite-type tricarboxylate transporter receptor subunit TctC